jgi:WD40 repeat protein
MSEEVLVPLDEGLSSVHFCPQSPQIFSTSSWAGTIRIYSAETRKETHNFEYGQPLLCSTWITDQVLASGSCDGQIFLTDGRQLSGHSGGISGICHFPDTSVIVSSSWDESIRIWDLSQAPENGSCITIGLRDRILSLLNSTEHRIVAHGSKNFVYIIDTRNPQKYERRICSLSSQIRSSCASKPIDYGWAIGSITGRVAIEYFGDLRQQAQRFSFSCGKVDGDENCVVYPVNALSFNPRNGVLVTGCANGRLGFWDIGEKKKLAEVEGKVDSGVAALEWDSNGERLLVGFSYTWDKGEIEHGPDRVVIYVPAISGDA